MPTVNPPHRPSTVGQWVHALRYTLQTVLTMLGGQFPGHKRIQFRARHMCVQEGFQTPHVGGAFVRGHGTQKGIFEGSCIFAGTGRRNGVGSGGGGWTGTWTSRQPRAHWPLYVVVVICSWMELVSLGFSRALEG